MHYLVCVDDTDMPGTKGTGWLVQEMCEHIENNNMGTCHPISRHQLFVHEDVPYTSHNSSMCFELQLKQTKVGRVIDFAADFLEKKSMQGSDPGLCVVQKNEQLNSDRLIAFGQSAKQQVLCKEQAYRLAKESGIHLSEHGGTGDGVIGALAGIGLRLQGEDGRYRGWYHLGLPGTAITVGELCHYPFIDTVLTQSGSILAPDTPVCIGSEKIKTIRMRNQQVVMVTENETTEENTPYYRTITHREAKMY